MPESFSDTMKSMSNMIGQLDRHTNYWAHIHPSKKEESLEEHVTLVNNYAGKLVEAHGLDSVIDSLITDSIENWEDAEKCAGFLKRCFTGVIMFHDFGKINENFQFLRMKNIAHFKENKKSILTPIHGHSKLGSFLYLSYFIDTIYKSDISGRSKILLTAYCFLLSYSITQHHSAALFSITGTGEYLVAFKDIFPGLREYISQYKWSFDETQIITIFNNLEKVWVANIKEARSYNVFSFYALIKLNFSLLTAADYLATHHYSNSSQGGTEGETTDFGVFTSRERVQEIALHLQSFNHNAKAFKKANNYQFQHPVIRSNENLNKLREEMAVEVIQTIRHHSNKRLFYLEAPTGGGKTNLSAIVATELLIANSELNKVYYVFPFTTLITQTFASLKESAGLRDNEVVEIHSKAPLHSKPEISDTEREYDGLYFNNERNSKKNYIDNLFALYPVTLLSHVKFFDVLKTNQKEANYLLHRLANSVVIIDELQTYNPKLWDKMLFFISNYAHHFNIRFVLMSATLPKINTLKTGLEHKVDFVDLLLNARTYISNPNFSQRVKFNFELFDKGNVDIDNLAEFVLKKSKEYVSTNRSVKTIIEFIYKKSAANFLKRVQHSELFDKIFLLSGTILEARRREVINYIKRNNDNENILLITTQVVEAGVDIDMDLGFKNVSLIDSDEQLAGRVNRNANKEACEVYLFKMDDASILYGADYRYKKTREQIDPATYQQILESKDFAQLYNKVIGYIDEVNKPVFKGSIRDYTDGLFHFDYPKVDREFKIIEHESAAVFVPLSLPMQIDSFKPDDLITVFSKEELRFLAQAKVYPIDNEISGEEVWELYKNLIEQRNRNLKDKSGFDMQQKVDFKQLQSIMSKFCFSLISHSKDYREMQIFGKEEYGYFYFTHYNDTRENGKLYNYEYGLNADAFSDSNFI